MALPVDGGYDILPKYTKPERALYLEQVCQERAKSKVDYERHQAEREAMAAVATKKGKWKANALSLANQLEEGPLSREAIAEP